jgi:hypothetical protein
MSDGIEGVSKVFEEYKIIVKKLKIRRMNIFCFGEGRDHLELMNS